MCDFSLQHVASRPAKVGDKLVTKDFGTGTRGFAAVDDTAVAVCVLPGTELAFDAGIQSLAFLGWKERETKVARFVQVNRDIQMAHHDALELPDGEVVKLTVLVPGQTATVLQLPATPKTEAEAKEQKRVAFAG